MIYAPETEQRELDAIKPRLKKKNLHLVVKPNADYQSIVPISQLYLDRLVRADVVPSPVSSSSSTAESANLTSSSSTASFSAPMPSSTGASSLSGSAGSSVSSVSSVAIAADPKSVPSPEQADDSNDQIEEDDLLFVPPISTTTATTSTDIATATLSVSSDSSSDPHGASSSSFFANFFHIDPRPIVADFFVNFDYFYRYFKTSFIPACPEFLVELRFLNFYSAILALVCVGLKPALVLSLLLYCLMWVCSRYACSFPRPDWWSRCRSSTSQLKAH
jgi:hypothetical protein